MSKRRKTLLVLLCCISYLLQPLAALATNLDRTFHEEIIGVTVDYGDGTPAEQMLVFQLDTDVQGFNHEFSDGTKYYGNDLKGKSTSVIAIAVSEQTDQTLFESPFEFFLPTNHFKSIPKVLEIRPPISA